MDNHPEQSGPTSLPTLFFPVFTQVKLIQVPFILRIPTSRPNSFLEMMEQTQLILYGPNKYHLFQEVYMTVLPIEHSYRLFAAE